MVGWDLAELIAIEETDFKDAMVERQSVEMEINQGEWSSA